MEMTVNNFSDLIFYENNKAFFSTIQFTFFTGTLSHVLTFSLNVKETCEGGDPLSTAKFLGFGFFLPTRV